MSNIIVVSSVGVPFAKLKPQLKTIARSGCFATVLPAGRQVTRKCFLSLLFGFLLVPLQTLPTCLQAKAGFPLHK